MISKMGYTAQKKVITVSFLAVPIALLVTFSFLPLISMFFYSFTDWNGTNPVMNPVGFDNYVRLFTRPEYFSVFGVSLYYFAGAIVQNILALFIASLIFYKVRAEGFFKGVVFIPYLLNGVAISFIFLFFFQPNGTLDSLLKALHLDILIDKWFLNRKIINVSLTYASVWRYFGFSFLLYLGAMQSVGKDVLEASMIDGANRFQQFFSIILPQIKRIVELNFILGIAGSISVFEMPYIMTSGSNGSMTFVIQTVESAFKFSKFGLASAMGIVLLLIVIIVTLLQRLFLREKE